MAITGLSETDGLYRALEEGLSASGVKVLPSPRDGVAVLRLDGRASRREILAVGTDGRVREYRLIESVRARVEQGDRNGAWRIFRVERDFLYDPNDVLGKQAEEQQLRREMAQDLARGVLMALPDMVPGQ